MIKPDFFIAGVPKSGTTAMYSYLKAHPDIFFPEVKEPCYFAKDIAGEYGQVKTLEEYQALYAPAYEKGLLAGDASPIYLMSDNAVREILHYNPAAKFIVILRNPIEMVRSVHNQAVKVAEETVDDFEAAWQLQNARAEGRFIPQSNTRPVNLQYKYFCSIGSQLERICARVPKDKLLILLYEDLQSDPKKCYLQVLEFLALKDDGRETFPVVNKSADIRSRRMQIWLKNPPHWLQPFRGICHKIGFRPLRLLTHLNRKTAAKKSLSLAMQRELTDSFREEIQKVEKILERDFSHWYKISAQ